MKFVEPDMEAPNFLAIGFGVVLTVAALMLSIGVIPMLLFAKDSRDLTGGIAGAVVILFMGLGGIFLILRQNAPLKLQKAFYYLFGILSILAGIGAIVMAVYELSQGTSTEVRKEYFTLPVLLIGLGVFWIRQGYSVAPADQQETEEVDT